jgi:hypothetical protein
MLEVVFATAGVVGTVVVILWRLRRAEAERPYSTFLRIVLTAFIVLLLLGFGLMLFLANPANWNTSSLSWPQTVSNAGIVAVVSFTTWYSIRQIWRQNHNA